MFDYKTIQKGNYKTIVMNENWSSMTAGQIEFEKKDLTKIIETDDSILYVFGCQNDRNHSYDGLVYHKDTRIFNFMNFDRVQNENYEEAMTNYEDGHLLVIDTIHSTEDTIILVNTESVADIFESYEKLSDYQSKIDELHFLNDDSVEFSDELHFIFTDVPLKALLMYVIHTNNVQLLYSMIEFMIENNKYTFQQIHETIDDIMKLHGHDAFMTFAISVEMIAKHYINDETKKEYLKNF